MEPLKTSGYAPVNGITMYYEIYGEGDLPLVLIHGGGSTIQSSFGNFLPLLSDYGKIIAVELQAHGRTSDRDAPESFEQDADDVAALLKHLKIAKANILGFSNGGTTTLKLAVRHPELVNKLVAIAAAWKREGLIPGFFEGMQGVTLDHMPGLLKEAYLEVNPDHKGLQVMFEKDKQRMIGFKDGSDEDLKAIQAPVLVMVADKDVVTVEHSREMCDLIPEARLSILPGTHGSCIGEVCTIDRRNKALELAARIIKEFLREGPNTRKRILDIMELDYDCYAPWCKVLQLRDFDESYLAGSPDKSEDELSWQEGNIMTVHHYIEDPQNPVYRDRFMQYFLYRLFVDYTPESMDTEPLTEQEWHVVSRAEAGIRLDHIISRSLEELKEYDELNLEEISEKENSGKFRSLKNSFLDVFTDDVIFLVNTDPDGDMPAIIGMDGNTTGIYFLGS